jgi:hypothetical protein
MKTQKLYIEKSYFITGEDTKLKIRNVLKKSLTIDFDTIDSTMSTDYDEKSKNTDVANFILCTLCNSYIHIDQIEKHSDTCMVDHNDVVCHVVDNAMYLKEVNEKLKKFEEHIRTISIVQGTKTNKLAIHDQTYLATLLQNISDLNKIGVSDDIMNGFVNIKKIITNIDTSILSFKGNLSVMILLERGRLLAAEKLGYLKEEYKKRKTNMARPSTINKVLELQKEIDEVVRKKAKMEVEKDKLKKKLSVMSNGATDNNTVDINSDVEECQVKPRNSQLVKKAKPRESVVSETESENETKTKDMLSYKEFCKMSLKVKFEKLNSGDPAQKVPEKSLYEEYKVNYFEGMKVSEFIINELKIFEKYKSVNKKSSRNIIRKLDTIHEE